MPHFCFALPEQEVTFIIAEEAASKSPFQVLIAKAAVCFAIDTCEKNHI